jgi:dUTPase
MSESELRRSLRRGVAVLLVPQSLLLVQVRVVTENLPGVVDSALPGLSRVVGLACLALAVSYLLASVARQVNAAADWPF